MCVAWGLSHHAPFEPVIIFSRGGIAFVYSIVRGGIAGYIRGHGGVRFSLDDWYTILCLSDYRPSPPLPFTRPPPTSFAPLLAITPPGFTILPYYLK